MQKAHSVLKSVTGCCECAFVNVQSYDLGPHVDVVSPNKTAPTAPIVCQVKAKIMPTLHTLQQRNTKRTNLT